MNSVANMFYKKEIKKDYFRNFLKFSFLIYSFVQWGEKVSLGFMWKIPNKNSQINVLNVSQSNVIEIAGTA